MKRTTIVAEQALLPGVAEPVDSPTLRSWALCELYGHQRIVGHVTVDPVEFPGMIRIDVPDLLKNGEVARKGHTRYIGRNAIYSITPVDEITVRNLLPHVDGLPARQASIGEGW
ncbi:MAG TPA: hypothetical protein VGD60_05355 [Candidatus Acidoferrales bacterium]